MPPLVLMLPGLRSKSLNFNRNFAIFFNSISLTNSSPNTVFENLLEMVYVRQVQKTKIKAVRKCKVGT
jgi:hypothetical protein